MKADFWKQCLDANVVIVPVKLYKNWNKDKELELGNYLGIKYACMHARLNETALDEKGNVFIEVRDYETQADRLSDTPDEALALWLKGKK